MPALMSALIRRHGGRIHSSLYLFHGFTRRLENRLEKTDRNIRAPQQRRPSSSSVLPSVSSSGGLALFFLLFLMPARRRKCLVSRRRRRPSQPHLTPWEMKAKVGGVWSYEPPQRPPLPLPLQRIEHLQIFSSSSSFIPHSFLFRGFHSFYSVFFFFGRQLSRQLIGSCRSGGCSVCGWPPAT